MSSEQTFYDLVGGEETFNRLVRRFYEGVREDPVLKPSIPTTTSRAPKIVCACSWCNIGVAPIPTASSAATPGCACATPPFVIGEAERDAWLKHMGDAVNELELPAEQESKLWQYLVYAAHSLVNA